MLRQPCDAREHLQGCEVEIGAFALPVLDDAVDLVGMRHPAIIARPGRAIDVRDDARSGCRGPGPCGPARRGLADWMAPVRMPPERSAIV
ncbi:hypothetical protein GCM10009761_01410 [Agromyces terreus]